MQEKTPLVAQICVLSDYNNKNNEAFECEVFFCECDLFLKNYVTSEGAVFHNDWYYQQLAITRYQVSCDAENYFK